MKATPLFFLSFFFGLQRERCDHLQVRPLGKPPPTQSPAIGFVLTQPIVDNRHISHVRLKRLKRLRFSTHQSC